MTPSPLDQFALGCFGCLLRLAPSFWLTKWLGEDDGDRADTHRNRVVATIYVVLVTAGLVAALICAPGGEAVKLVVGGLVIWRLLEIFTVGLGIVLMQENSLIGYSLVTVAFWATQVTLGFAVLDHSFATTAFVIHEAGGVSKVASQPFEYLYISWTQMVTVGNAYQPMTDIARVLTMAASTSGVLLLAVFVASALTHDRARIDRGQLIEEIVIRFRREWPRL